MTRIQREALIPEKWADRRLDQAAAALWPEFSRSRIKQWIECGALRLDGNPVIPRTRVNVGQALSLDAQLTEVGPAAPEAIPLNVVWEDSQLLVIDKPAGLVVHPGAGNPTGTLQNGLLYLDAGLAELPRAGIVHRLDKDTTGLLLVARTLAAHRALVEQLERRAIKRRYQAICQGVVVGGGTVNAALGRHPRDRLRMAVLSHGGREARTHYRVAERFRAHTLLRVELDTGRTHQIRVHMAHIRHPLVGDRLYGGRPKLPPAAAPELADQLRNFPRQALHAGEIALAHPSTGEPLHFMATLPEDMAGLLAALRADAGKEAQR